MFGDITAFKTNSFSAPFWKGDEDGVSWALLNQICDS